jgi:hypothetical protein
MGARGIVRAGLGLVFGCLTFVAVAVPPRMGSRPAPSEVEQPRVHVPDVRWLANLPQAGRVRLDAPSALESEIAKAATTKRAAGYGRRVDPAVSRLVATRGESALRFSVASPGALHLRAAVRFADAAQYRITSYRPGGEAEAVTLYRTSSSTSMRMPTVWTPVSDGDTQTVVVERLGAPVPEWHVDVESVSHFDRPLDREDVTPDFFGASAACQVDIACVYEVAPTAMQAGIVKANFSVAMMIFTRADGLSYVCTGTLLNSVSYPAPIFLTAHHCLDDPEALASLTTTWSYNRTACLSGSVSGAATQVAGGATSLFDSRDLDAALIQLNQMPPAVATYTGWDASTMQPGERILAIHHPEGDVKKASFGTELGIEPDALQFIDAGTYAPATFYVVTWELGIIEPGSSGSALLSFNAGYGLFYLRGTLTGGTNFSCGGVGQTYYARFDNLYPSIQAVLSGAPSPPAGTAVAVEYYYADWNFYFETSFANEIAALDGGAFGGAWKRTGETFAVWPAPTGSAMATCRFFSNFDPKSSHFYTPFANECASLKAGTVWQFEGIAFYVQLPDDGGACPSGTIPLYRAYNNGMGGAPNHRYTTSLAILGQMLAAGWVFEGNGITKVFACVPQ